MSGALDGLKPETVWKYFGAISRIPRGSKNEAAVAAYVLETARKLGCEAVEDGVMNVLARKPASPGREGVKSVCLQGHLDMVCEKNADKQHDFLVDPLELVRKGDVLMANGTTLGADNGIAVATMLALLEEKGLEHGPIECLFTIDEETGLTGAGSLTPDFVRSRTLINLDSEEEGALYVGCAGGRDSVGVFPAATEAVSGKMVSADVIVKGLKGGHSGLDIDKGRGNALKILVRALLALDALNGRIASIEGGNKRNAIPREARARIFLSTGKVRKAQEAIATLREAVKAENARVDPDVDVSLAVGSSREGMVLKRLLGKKILRTIAALPHGVIKMSPDIPGLVETSTNVAVVRTSDDAVRIETSQRSSVASEIEEIVESVKSVFVLAGTEIEAGKGYPGWKPNMDSAVLATAKKVHAALFGKEPHVKAVHAGLECGIIGEKFPGMDMVSLGPTLEAVHSPEEKIFIPTVDRFWKYLLEILKAL
jgi:dipeptidase D